MRMTAAEADELAAYRGRYGWHRSDKGNLCRRLHDGRIVTIFPIGTAFNFCITKNSKPTYSNGLWTTEDAAREAAMRFAIET